MDVTLIIIHYFILLLEFDVKLSVSQLCSDFAFGWNPLQAIFYEVYQKLDSLFVLGFDWELSYNCIFVFCNLWTSLSFG